MSKQGPPLPPATGCNELRLAAEISGLRTGREKAMSAEKDPINVLFENEERSCGRHRKTR
jgi:hypothetical protein